MLKRMLIIITALITSVALAATVDLPPVPNFDLAEWAADSAAFGAVIVFIVALVRKYIWGADGNQVPLLSIGIGILGGAALGFAGYFDGNVVSGIVHGLSAGVFAFLGVDGVRSVVKTPDKAYNPQVKP